MEEDEDAVVGGFRLPEVTMVHESVGSWRRERRSSFHHPNMSSNSLGTECAHGTKLTDFNSSSTPGNLTNPFFPSAFNFAPSTRIMFSNLATSSLIRSSGMLHHFRRLKHRWVGVVVAVS